LPGFRDFEFAFTLSYLDLAAMGSRNRVVPTSPRLDIATEAEEWRGLSAGTQSEGVVGVGPTRTPTSPPSKPHSHIINSRRLGTSSMTSADIFSVAQEANLLQTAAQSMKVEAFRSDGAERAAHHSDIALYVFSCEIHGGCLSFEPVVHETCEC
jgi:hypothetical protein